MNQLAAMSTYFKKRNYNTWSFADKGDNPKQIDHFLIRQSDKKRIRNCEVNDATGILSDHHSLNMRMAIKTFIPKKGSIKSPITSTNKTTEEFEPPKKTHQIDWTSIREQPSSESELSPKAKWNAKLDELLENHEATKDAPPTYKELADYMRHAGSETLQSGIRKRKPWFNMSESKLLKAIEERNIALAKYTRD